jgi:ABC-type multidrug transport system fused ATPase/permease subunit
VPPLLQTLHGERCYEALERHFKDTVDAGAPSLAAAAWRANRHGWWRAGLAFGLMWALFVVQPLQLRLLVSDLEGSHELTAAQLWLTACGLLVSGLLQTLMFNWHQIFIARRKMAIRSALCVAVFRKSLRLSPRGRGRGGASTGRIVNLMSTDAEQSAAMFEAVNMLWTFPLAIGVGLWLMYEQVGDALLFGLGFLLLLMLPPQLLVFGKMAGLHAEMLGIADERVKLVGEYLAGMRVVKLSAWEPRVAAQISAVFAREAAVLYRLAMWLSAGGLTLLLAAPLLVPVVIFIAYVELGNELTASRAFTTLALYGVVRWPFGLWGGAMQAVVSAFVSLRRLQAYLLLPELPSEPVAEPADPALAVEVRGATFAWEAATEEEEEEEEEAAAGAAGAAEAEKQQQGVELVKQKAPPFALRDLELRVPKGALVAVVGRVGAGKSTLLAGLLGETRCDRSRVAIRGRVGYCAQHAWVMNDSLIGNVLMGQPLDRQRFDRVIEATALAPDLKQLPNGEQTEIGERVSRAAPRALPAHLTPRSRDRASTSAAGKSIAWPWHALSTRTPTCSCWMTC